MVSAPARGFCGNKHHQSRPAPPAGDYMPCEKCRFGLQNGTFRMAIRPVSQCQTGRSKSKAATGRAQGPQACPGNTPQPVFGERPYGAKTHAGDTLFSFFLHRNHKCSALSPPCLNPLEPTAGKARIGKWGGATSPHGQGNKNPASGHWRGSALPFAGLTVTDACRHAPGRVTSPCHRPSASCRP